MMILTTARASAWIVQTTATLPVSAPGGSLAPVGRFDQVAHVATGLVSIVLLLLLLLAFPAAWYLHNRLKQLAITLDGLRADVGPLVAHTESVMKHADAIATTVRRDVERVSETVAHFDGQLREIADIAGDRVRDFDALLGSVQEEVEGVFLTSASAARGIRAGFRALGRHRARKSRQAALRAERESESGTGDDDIAPMAPEGEDRETRPREPRLRRRGRGT